MKRTNLWVVVGVMLLVIAGIFSFTPAFSQADTSDTTPFFPAPNWSSSVRISTNSTLGASNPVIAVAPNGTLLTVFTKGVDNDIENLAFVQSTNSGDTWSNPSFVHTSNVDSRQAALAFTNNNVAHAVWRELSAPNAILHSRQDQWGNNTTTTIISSSQLLFKPSIAATGNNTLDVVWEQVEDTSVRNIYHSRSTNGGATWSTPIPLADDIQGSSQAVITSDSAGNLHVVWEEDIFRIVNGIPQSVIEIRYRKGTVSNGNVNWGNTSTISPSNLSTARRPTIHAQGTQLHVAFARQENDLSNADYYAYYITSSGGSWSNPVDTTRNAPIGVNGTDPQILIPTVAVCNNNTYLYYHGTFAQNENEGLYGGNKTDGWVRESITPLNARHINPDLVCSNNKIHMVFERIQPNTNDRQIYYFGGQLEEPGRISYLPILFSP